MNKFILLTCLLSLTTSIQSMKPIKNLFTEANKLSQALRFTRIQTDESHNLHEDIKNTDPRVKNYVLQTTVFKNYEQYRPKVEGLVKVGADPNSIPHNGLLPLTVALDNDDTAFITLLLANYANPNLFVNQMAIDINNHQETGSCPNLHQFEGKPAFYFAKNCKTAQLCLDYGAQPNLKYCNHGYKHKPEYGNVITHVIDHHDYHADLINLYLEHGAGPYSKSYASYNGSAIHHLLEKLNSCSDDTHVERLLICAKYLLIKAPCLLISKDQDENTPGDCLNFAMKRKDCKKDTLKKFAQLFDQYSAIANIKNKSRE